MKSADIHDTLCFCFDLMPISFSGMRTLSVILIVFIAAAASYPHQNEEGAHKIAQFLHKITANSLQMGLLIFFTQFHWKMDLKLSNI